MNNSMKENVTILHFKSLSENSFLYQNGPHFTGLSVVRGQEVKKIPPMDMLFNLPPLFSPLSGDYRERIND